MNRLAFDLGYVGDEVTQKSQTEDATLLGVELGSNEGIAHQDAGE
jgi:hypothetical protein